MKEKLLQKEILAVLFYKNDEMSVAELAKLLEADQDSIHASLEGLEELLEHIGLVLIVNKDKYSLATSPELSGLVERMTKEELSHDVSAASLETLSIIAYKGIVTRKEIEYIRGVNSSFSLRALLMRGLIEREGSSLDERIFLYKPSVEMLKYLGLKSLEELPEWKSVQTEMSKIEEKLVEERDEEMQQEIQGEIHQDEHHE